MLEVRLELFSAIDDYARVPTAFPVTSLIEPTPDSSAPGGYILRERGVELPYIKDYDAIPDNSPPDWGRSYDTSKWQLFSAFKSGKRVGGAIAFVFPAETREKFPVVDLWDLRVAPEFRRMGIASALASSVEQWATFRECGGLRIETQNINVAACRFYERFGCELQSVTAGAYPALPNEIRLLWYKPRDRFESTSSR